MAIEKTHLKEKLLQAVSHLEQGLHKVKYIAKDKLHLLDPLTIQPYYGYGNDYCVYLKGRVLEQEKIQEPKEGTADWQHIENTIKRYETDEIPGILLKASYGGKEVEVRTNEEGYFNLEFCFDTPINYEHAGNKVKLHLLETKTKEDQTETEGTIFVPARNAEFGIISDIDDTVMVSNINNLVKRLREVLLKDAAERSPFPGIASFLQALCTGYDAQASNPLFYVSNSEWNLFDLLVNFFRYHHIPEGPLFLRDKGLPFEKGAVTTNTKDFKHTQVCRILDTYPQQKFILIGDNGQHDPGIYQQVVDEYPGRILGIYIRDMADEDKDRQVARIAEAVRKKGVDMFLSRETLSAARHARRKQWINDEQLRAVEEECKKEDQHPKQ